MTTRLGLFGGTFNPPHIAHLAVAEALGEALDLEQVLWMPAATSPFKRDDPATVPAQHRLAMVQLATAGNPRFAVSDLEVRRAGVSYTVDTVEAIRGANPEQTLVLLLGGDSLASITRWHRWEDLVAQVPLAVYRRPDDGLGEELRELPTAVRTRVTVVDAPRLDLSSTQLRKSVAEGRSIRYLVPEALRKYIDKHGLYKNRAQA
ncbi:MAG: nicotinate (nicotinamide) nucleotide adenylyltransferase [Bacteroidota bacterium]